MKLYLAGLASGYEPEHVARLFWPTLQLVKSYPTHRPDAIVIRKHKMHILCGVRVESQVTFQKILLPEQVDKKREETILCTALFQMLCGVTGKRPPWGMLTGVRPVRLVRSLYQQGMNEEQVANHLTKDCFVSKEKLQLAMRIEKLQRPILAQVHPRSFSLYISIPFCPSRCSYCSFVSRTTGESAKLIEPYVERLCEELNAIGSLSQKLNLKLETIYIGGGTPTAISADQLRRLMKTVNSCFDVAGIQEYTVEAGRPDCTTPEKLAVLKEYGATRISINPQTLSDEVLRAIGRRHTAQDVLDCFDIARKLGHNNINMDLIAGLPLDTVEGFSRSLSGVMALGPENITVHTLTLKRASTLVEDHAPDRYADVAKMLSCCSALSDAGYVPYYMYRQKGTLQNLENTGYTKPGYSGLYNIYIMEEVHTILSAGAGGSTKMVAPDGHIKRIFNHKYPLEYLRCYDVVQQRKQGIEDFYGQYVDLDS
ncbi:coproporphyrinogen dehydrogenase HemZ [uncultured Ruthenibacterium sp.]|uniref:coproporphyrinogen dehydrogenase HemZ n=1 Tax=uncultured Ruthenibacterium sp. TaxID=1905347 RepID=UPI00349E85E3